MLDFAHSGWNTIFSPVAVAGFNLFDEHGTKNR